MKHSYIYFPDMDKVYYKLLRHLRYLSQVPYKFPHPEYSHFHNTVLPEFLDGFKSFIGLATVVVPAVVGFIASKLQNPMNRWVTCWVTAVVGVVVTLFSWWMDLGFPPSDASIWIVVIDALFVALASTGIVSVVTSEWLAKLFGGKVKKE